MPQEFVQTGGPWFLLSSPTVDVFTCWELHPFDSLNWEYAGSLFPEGSATQRNMGNSSVL